MEILESMTIKKDIIALTNWVMFDFARCLDLYILWFTFIIYLI